MNSVFFQKCRKKYFFSFLAAGFCPKNNGSARVSGGCFLTSPPGSYAHGHSSFIVCTFILKYDSTYKEKYQNYPGAG